MKLPPLRIPKLGPTPIGLAGTMALLGVLGPFLPRLLTAIVISLLIYTALAYSINFITGMTGYVSFGHVVFLGVGGYSLGYTVQTLQLPPLAGVALGAGVGALFAYGVGIVTLRFRGVYFAIASLVTVLATLDIVLEMPALQGGSGIFLNIGFQPLAWYYTIWVVVAIEIGLTVAITRGRIGYAVRAIKSDEDAAKAIGIDAARIKLYLFCLSGLFGGMAGAVFAWQNSGVFPYDIFSLTFSLLMLAMIVVGGMGTVLGPFLGAVIVYLPSFFFLTVVIGAQDVIIGILVILIALIIPEGIVGTLRKYVVELRGILE